MGARSLASAPSQAPPLCRFHRLDVAGTGWGKFTGEPDSLGLTDLVRESAVAMTFTTVVRGVKLRGHAAARPSLTDALWAAALGPLPLVADRAGGPVALAAVSLALLVTYVLVLVDTVLWRAFTMEFGPRVAAEVMLSGTARESTGMGRLRVFFLENRAFLLLPGVLVAWLASPLLGPHAARATETTVVLALATGIAVGPVREVLCAWAGPSAALVCLAVGGLRPSAGVALGGAQLLLVGGLAASRPLQRRWSLRSSLMGDFLLSRVRPATTTHQPLEPGEQRLHALTERPARRSLRFGALRGRDVLLITLESVGRDHLAVFDSRGARTPFIEGVFADAVVSRCHFSLSPRTTNAHLLLAHGRYRPAGASHIAHLAAAGFRTAYLTSCDTRYFGLGAVLEEAGYERIIDRRDLGPQTCDRDLSTLGMELLGRFWDDHGAGRAPRFLHVHTSDTHVPYRVHRPRPDRHGDRARFLDAVEESDEHLARLHAALTSSGLLHDPLVVVTSDHGQAFGTLGYLTHGSAVTAEQTVVPFALSHPDLPSGEVTHSSHLDVMPTVLDLLGLDPAPCHGESVFHLDRPSELVLWAGHSARSTTACYGAVIGPRKVMLDLVTDRCLEMDWDDRDVRVLTSAERRHTEAVVTAALLRLGLD